ncbi:MAG TPA: FAD-dependent oxidoreductase, partial [Micavibrio sp.]
AGTSCAAALMRRGLDVVLHDDHGLAAMASGNPVGLYNPRFSQYRSAQSDFFASGYAALCARNDPAQRVGSLHLITDDERRKRLSGFLQQGGWHTDHARLVGAADASEIAGVALTQDCLWLPDSGYISPRDLCAAYAGGVPIKPTAFDPQDYDAVILAQGAGVKEYPGLADLPLQTVRGQISFLRAAADFQTRTNICYGGYLSAPQADGGYVAGATFQQWRDDVMVDDADHQAILLQLNQAVPATTGQFQVTGGRASLRCAARDRFPVVGAVADAPHLYVSTAHGSHGLISTIASAEYLADLICGGVVSLSAATAQALSPRRFADRALKKDRQKAKFNE